MTVPGSRHIVGRKSLDRHSAGRLDDAQHPACSRENRTQAGRSGKLSAGSPEDRKRRPGGWRPGVQLHFTPTRQTSHALPLPHSSRRLRPHSEKSRSAITTLREALTASGVHAAFDTGTSSAITQNPSLPYRPTGENSERFRQEVRETAIPGENPLHQEEEVVRPHVVSLFLRNHPRTFLSCPVSFTLPCGANVSLPCCPYETAASRPESREGSPWGASAMSVRWQPESTPASTSLKRGLDGSPPR